MKTAKIHIRRSSDGQYYFTLNAKNGKVLMTSETYKRKQGCDRGVSALIEAFYFDLTGKVVGTWAGPGIIDHTNP